MEKTFKIIGGFVLVAITLLILLYLITLVRHKGFDLLSKLREKNLAFKVTESGYICEVNSVYVYHDGKYKAYYPEEAFAFKKGKTDTDIDKLIDEIKNYNYVDEGREMYARGKVYKITIDNEDYYLVKGDLESFDIFIRNIDDNKLFTCSPY